MARQFCDEFVSDVNDGRISASKGLAQLEKPEIPGDELETCLVGWI